MADYLDRFLINIVAQGEIRGIPKEEAHSVLAFIAAGEGKRVIEMNDRELQRVQTKLGTYFYNYLEGKKRRDGPAQHPPEGGFGCTHTMGW